MITQICIVHIFIDDAYLYEHTPSIAGFLPTPMALQRHRVDFR
jgi:hypothetical protein